jgi:hypothetical protein
MRPVDIDYVERQRPSCESLCFGNELFGQRGRGDEIENVDRVQGDRTLSTQSARWDQRFDVPCPGPRFLARCGDQAVAAREMPVERRARHAGRRSDVLE